VQVTESPLQLLQETQLGQVRVVVRMTESLLLHLVVQSVEQVQMVAIVELIVEPVIELIVELIVELVIEPETSLVLCSRQALMF
jgi:hypothetical protein